MDLEKLCVKVEVNEDDSYKVLLELYKNLSAQIILTAEKCVYKTMVMNGFKNVLNDNNSIKSVAGDFIFNIFKFLEKGVNSDNLGIYLNKIMEESNEDRILVMTKLFSMIESFYESMDRENLDIEDVENYFQNITEQFTDYSLINTEYFIDIIQDKDIDMNCDFKIKIED